MKRVEISIVIPVYNSASCLDALYAEIVRVLGTLDWELVLVNDNSKDRSWEIIRNICKTDVRVCGVSLRKNAGQNCAIMAGLKMAAGRFVVIMDDDLQHQPTDILKLYREMQERPCDVCYASYEKKQKAWKNLGSWLNGKLSEKLLGKPPHLYLSPFKMMKWEIVLELLEFKGADPYVDAMILKTTSAIRQIQVEHHERIGGKSNFNFSKSLSIFISHATYSVSPLRMLTIIGFSSSLIAFLTGAAFLMEYLFSERRVEGWMSVILLIIFFGGLTIMSIGLIGEYIARIFLSVNSGKQYYIAELVNRNENQTD